LLTIIMKFYELNSTRFLIDSGIFSLYEYC
jgi:hypothetical protein